MAVARVRVRGLHEMPLERLLFIIVLGCSVLLLSVVMIRSEQVEGGPQAAPRPVFRDGFIVAQQHDIRRTESNGTAVIVLSTDEDEKKTGAGPQVQVERQGEHMMTKIKTEDGDEITIKRATNSNKITTISAHDDGKITIENREVGDDVKKPSGGGIRSDEGKEERLRDDEGTRRVGYEKIAPGKERPHTPLDDPELMALDDPLRRIETNEAAVKVDEKKVLAPEPIKKVTVVEVGRSQTKVSVQDAPARQATEGEKLVTRQQKPFTP